LQELEFKLPNGIHLAAHAFGDPEHPPVLLSHGGGQTRHSWGATAEALANAGWYAVCYDHRGHGNSSWSEDGDYALDRFAEDQRELALQFSIPPILVGASLGGLAAMVAQGESEQAVFRAVVFVDIVPRMSQQGATDVIAFMGTHMEEGFANLDEAADVIANYTGRPRRKDISGLRKNLRLDDDGRYRWHWDPNFVRERSSPDQLADSDRLSVAVSNMSLPMMLIRGQLSNLVTPQLAEDFLQLAPHAHCVDVADAHHMVAGDRNDIFGKAVIDFIARLPH
jgi:pimeloyl-ACP methyl ester carboxylesterase